MLSWYQIFYLKKTFVFINQVNEQEYIYKIYLKSLKRSWIPIFCFLFTNNYYKKLKNALVKNGFKVDYSSKKQLEIAKRLSLPKNFEPYDIKQPILVKPDDIKIYLKNNENKTFYLTINIINPEKLKLLEVISYNDSLYFNHKKFIDRKGTGRYKIPYTLLKKGTESIKINYHNILTCEINVEVV
ncbi:hypothetical protein SLITO_v1c06510 [Spiroplasma litorale]|uniref:Uncharacterized protein n=1 Tax=Spiroplasma litorale TaxID=216942 RepID=A0A0K1W1U3_9MOLU|nr:hypothetical protein [Spiroplasma litorale]AKX34280.1 hypothetical protein SLITO_v1c06510 [Spiroplasma litorale]